MVLRKVSRAGRHKAPRASHLIGTNLINCDSIVRSVLV